MESNEFGLKFYDKYNDMFVVLKKSIFIEDIKNR